MKKTRLIIFAREPKEGWVKTRLLKNYPQPLVTSLYKAFIKDVLSVAQDIPCSEKVIYFTGSRSTPYLRKFKRNFLYRRQMGKDLGVRMHKAFVESERQGFERTVIIGTDTPHLGRALIKKAFHELSRHDAVFGPARDGGYYLIGLRKPSKLLFSRIRWGTSMVLNTTLTRAQKLEMKVCLLPWLSDIDCANDLKDFTLNPDASKMAPKSWRAAKKLF